METFASDQDERESGHHKSHESIKELLIPETHYLFRYNPNSEIASLNAIGFIIDTKHYIHHRYRCRNYHGKATGGLMGNVLAKSGVKMVFIFMQRLWRVGNEVDVGNCVEVMRSAIEEIQAIPVAGFFNLSEDCDTLPFWSGVTEQTYKFLKNTVLW